MFNIKDKPIILELIYVAQVLQYFQLDFGSKSWCYNQLWR